MVKLLFLRHIQPMETSEKKSSPAKNIIFIIVIAAILGGAVYYAVSKYQYNKRFVDTDNAQINADISPVVARIPGYVDQIYFEENTPVRQGEILIHLDDKEMKLRLRQTEAGLGATKANVNVSRTGVDVSKAGLAASSANVAAVKQNLLSAKEQINAAKIRVDATQKEFNRFSNLLAEGATTQQIFDKVKAERDGAQVQYNVALNQYEVLLKQVAAAENQANVTRQQVQTSQSQVEAANTGLTAREVDIELIKLNLGHTMVAAPISGVLAKKNVQIGQFVQPGQSLFAIVNDSTMHVMANFKETQIEKMAVGQEASIVVDAYPDVTFKGKVLSFSPATGAKFSLLPPDNATGNFTKVVQRVPVKIAIEIPAEYKDKLKPGLSAHVTVKVQD
jgi:membrane fusion protein, multidrug efflux system